jgi:hypothetical protein
MCHNYSSLILLSQVMAVTRGQICQHGMDALPRYYTLIYYASVFLYYWVFSTPVVSLVFGCYLYISINWFNLHFDEAFSSLRIANYKSFCRCHIRPDGSLEVRPRMCFCHPSNSKGSLLI